MREAFKCPNCNSENYVEFAPNETQRTIPCMGCYYEEWIPAKPDPNKMVFDTVKGVDVPTEMIPEQKVEHGVRFTVVKGTGTIVE